MNDTLQKEWHVAHFHGLNSNNVIKLSERLSKEFGADNVFCPVVEEKKFNRKKRSFVKYSVPLYFGYIMIRCDNDSSVLSIIRKITERFYFLETDDGKFATVTPEEIDNIKEHLEENATVKRSQTGEISVGERVRILGGPFSNFIGGVISINVQKNSAKLVIDVFKQSTMIEAPLDLLARLSDDSEV